MPRLDQSDSLAQRFLKAGPQALRPEEWKGGIRTASLADETEPWTFGLPHHDHYFSRQHLRVQLNQATDQGARRLTEQIYLLNWLHDFGVEFEGKHVVQPLCGPGITAHALCRTARVASYLGIDIGPAPCAHARWRMRRIPQFSFAQELISSWRLPDSRLLDVILLLYEAANSFSPAALRQMLLSLGENLRPGGCIVIELRQGRGAAIPPLRRVRRVTAGGLFTPEPHLVLEEQGTFRDSRCVGHQYLVVPLWCAQVGSVYRSVVRLYSVEEIAALVGALGLRTFIAGRPFERRVSDVLEVRDNVVLVARMH